MPTSSRVQTPRSRRAQAFTVDLLVGILLLTVAIGSAAYLFQLNTQAARAEIERHNDALAAVQGDSSDATFCTTYTDVTGASINTTCASATGIWNCRDWQRRTRFQYTAAVTPTVLALTAEGCPGEVNVT